LEDRFCDLWERLNSDQIVISDEFITSTRVVSPSALRTDEPWAQADLVKFTIKKFYPLDHSFLVATPFDSLYTAICGNRDALESAGVEDLFEGFWCNSHTTYTWWR
jgi:thymidylate kinase